MAIARTGRTQTIAGKRIRKGTLPSGVSYIASRNSNGGGMSIATKGNKTAKQETIKYNGRTFKERENSKVGYTPSGSAYKTKYTDFGNTAKERKGDRSARRTTVMMKSGQLAVKTSNEGKSCRSNRN